MTLFGINLMSALAGALFALYVWPMLRSKVGA